MEGRLKAEEEGRAGKGGCEEGKYKQATKTVKLGTKGRRNAAMEEKIK